MANVPRRVVHSRYVKKNGEVIIYYRRAGRYDPIHRGPQLSGRARRVKPAQVDLYLTDVARRLRDLRLERGVSVAELAAGAGVSEFTVFDLESGRSRTPSMTTLVRIAYALGLSPPEMLP